MSRDVSLYLEDMRDAAHKAMRFVEGMSFEQFVASELVFDATIRNLEIIGEAARHVPDNLRERYPGVPWAKLVGFRNVLAHAYVDVDAALVWDTLIHKVPELLRDLDAIIDGVRPM